MHALRLATGVGLAVLIAVCEPTREPPPPLVIAAVVNDPAPLGPAEPVLTARPLVPVTAFMSPVESISLGELRRVIVPIEIVANVRVALPGVEVIGLADPLQEVRDGVGIGLLPPELVDASVKSLAVDGVYFWDPSADLAHYPLSYTTDEVATPVTRWDVLAAGEMIFGRGVQERIEVHHGGDARAAFTEVRDLVRTADLALATLEAPLSGNANRWCDTCMRFVGNERYAPAIADAGFDVLSLAANHIGDAGRAGVLDTIRVLGENGLAYAGAGADAVAARRPALADAGGRRLAILAYNDVAPAGYAALSDGAGSAWLSHLDPTYAELRREIADARSLADVVIVMAHWGTEYEDAPRPQVVAAAHAMVDAGATVVIGDHPHWVQSVELYRGAYIAYGVGNFVFDQMWSAQTREGSIHQLFFDGARLVAVRIRPTIIDDFYRPRLLAPTEPAYDETLARIWRHSIVR